MHRAILTIALLLLVNAMAFAQPPEIPVTGQGLPPPIYNQGGYAPTPGELPADDFSRAMVPYPDSLGEPPWCDSPYRSSAWRIGLDLIPTVSHVSEQAFGQWDDDGALALRLSLGYENCDGIGTRLQFWGFGQESATLAGDVELGASTFYWDFYKRLFVQDTELVFGGGLAGSHLAYDLQTLGEDASFSGGGLSLFGEGFYPVWRYKKTDIGSIARARFALLSGEWEDDGTPFINDTQHDLMTIIELAWGLELRRRFGLTEDNYWYVSIVPEFQRWESGSLFDEFDPGFQGTNFNFGLAW